MNKGSINLFNNEVSIIEIITIITNATIVKIKCFEKKSNNLYLVSHRLMKK